MKIVDSTVTTEASREFEVTHSVSVTQELTWKRILDDRISAYPDMAARARVPSRFNLLGSGVSEAAGTEATSLSGDDVLDIVARQLALITAILESLFSRLAADITFSLTGNPVNKQRLTDLETPGPRVAYAYRESVESIHYERETTRFSSDGSVVTDDGRSIDFSLELDMDREYLEKSDRVREESGTYQLLDPLVVNFNGRIPDMTDTTFSFDLDMDGETESLFSLGKGSGLLAFDRNGDGVINDGGELFGTRTDNGFMELREHDLDGNNWIDENDPVFDQLSVWDTGNGEESLVSLKESGVGAIFLGHEETSFDLTGPENDLRARIDKTGIFLDEKGGAGTVQEIKFVV